MTDIPKDRPILAFVNFGKGPRWMVIEHNGYHWQSVPGKYGVRTILRWATLPDAPEPDSPAQVQLPQYDGDKS